MNEHKSTPIAQRAMGVLSQCAVPLGFFAIMAFLYTYLAPFEFDKDEGVNLIKSMMVARGYPLYQTVWSDQPPVLTMLLAGVFRLFGHQVGAARMLILAFSSALLWGVWRYLRALGGRVAAFLGVALVIALPYYLRLSLSVMVGLPSMALAVLALVALVAWHRNHAWGWLLISAVLLGLSILTKLFTGFLAPIFLVGILVGSRRAAGSEGPRLRLGPAILWAGLLAILIVGALVFQPGSIVRLDDLWTPHMAARSVSTFGTLSFWVAAQDVRLLLCLALVGAGVLLWRRRWLSLYPLAWLVLALLLLADHAPVWYHHQLLVSVPAALLVAGALPEVWAWAREGRAHGLDAQRGVAVAAMAGALALALVTQAPTTVELFSDMRSLADRRTAAVSKEDQLVAEMASHALQTDWVLTDRPMYAFRAGLSVPPAVAAITSKRLATGALTESEMLTTILTFRPEQILLTRFDWPRVMESLQSGYHLVYSRSGKNLFIRNGIR